jgi:hypothetical protein
LRFAPQNRVAYRRRLLFGIDELDDLRAAAGGQQGGRDMRRGICIRFMTADKMVGDVPPDRVELRLGFSAHEALEVLIRETDQIAGEAHARGEVGAEITYV